MRVALELPARQASRILEQALRKQATFKFELCNGPDTISFEARFFERADDLLALEVINLPDDCDPHTWIGQYFDASMELSEELYLFTSSVMDCPGSDGSRILVSVPETITVVNRRRFERTNATIASQTRFFFDGDGQGFLGLLSSISGSGLAANLPDTACDPVALVGDVVRVRFELPGFEGDFELPGVLCSKSIEQATQQMRLGVEFEIGDDMGAADDLQRLRACLAEMTINLTE